ncbi:MAG: LytR/AlgR family response regulator transcription factor [Chitinophagaceae bacterium]
MIKCLIVDDEPLAQQVLERYILQSDQLQLIGKCNNVFEAHNTLQKEEIDIVFMDIKMPAGNGLEFIKSLKQIPAVIFTTAYSQYAAESYSVNAIDYLLKPITEDRFLTSISKFKKQLNTGNPTLKNYLYIKTNGSLIKIMHPDILYVQSMKDYLKIVTPNDKYLTHLTMVSLLDILPPEKFIRIHRSFIIQISYIKSITKKEVLLHEYVIPIGENYKKNLTAIEKGF